MKVLAINGSYRDDGVTDQVVGVVVESLQARAAQVEVVNLRDYPIEFCLNCRECTQLPGESPGRCVLEDGMQQLIQRIEACDALVLASPTNFYSVTALFKRFMERLLPYAYWPWQQHGPKFRKTASARKKALLIASSAAPGLLGRWLFATSRQLKMTAKMLGADPVGVVFTGMVGQQTHPGLSARTVTRAEQLASRLLG